MPRPLHRTRQKPTKAGPLTQSTAATLEWRRRSHGKGVRRPSAAYCCDLLRACSPLVFIGHPMLNANSRYCVPSWPIAPGTRPPNERKLPDDYAGLPRDLNSKLRAEAVAKLRAVFCLPATCQAAVKHQTKEHRSKAFNAKHSGDLGVAPKEPRKGRPAATGRVLLRLVNFSFGLQRNSD